MDWRKIEATWRPAPFWSWNDAMNSKELARQIREMAEKGWGGFFMHARVGLVTGYLSPQWMDLVRTCIAEAKATGTAAWLYDEDKWPSGFAGGEVPEKDKAYRSRALVLLKKEELTADDAVLAEAEGKYIARRIAPLGNLWFNGASYVDLMNPEAVKFFFETTHERYAKELGEHFGKEIPGIFTDEPCYLMEGHYDVPTVPWSEYLPDFFQQLKGYDITEHLLELFFDEGEFQKIRFDFYDAATRLFRESFTRQYYDWCNQNNLKLTGHFMAEDNLAYQTQWVGAAMPHYEFMHWPGIDKLGRNLQQLVTVKQLTSVADQLDKERSFCEVFGCTGQQNSFFHRKWIGDWQAALGINFVNEHLSLYSMRGERKRDYPPNLFYQQPWWEEEGGFAEYLGRVSKAVTQGKRALDILILHPIASVWSLYSPLHKQVDLALEQTIEVPFEELSQALVEAKLDFHYGDEIIMEDHAQIKGKKLVVGSHEYGTVIIPPSLTLHQKTVELLKSFAKAGGRILFLQQKPQRIDGSPAALDLAGELFDTVDEMVANLDELYFNRIQIRDKVTAENARKIICHQRTTDEGNLFFLANTNEKREIQAIITLPDGADNVSIIDLHSGEEYQAPLKAGKLELTFYPAGSILLFAAKEKRTLPEVPLYFASGVAFPCQLMKYADIENWQVETLEDNVLPLNKVTLDLDGKRVLTQEPIAKAWHQHFYPAPDGTPFRAEYGFEVEETVHQLVAVIEVAENLERILIDGQEVKPLKAKGEEGALDPRVSWKDPNFTKVPLGTVEKGHHTLVLEGKKVNNITGPGWHRRVEDFQNHRPTEVETVYLLGDFAVISFDNKNFAIQGGKTLPGGNLTSSGFPFYAGKARFEASFTIEANKRLILELGDVAAADVKIYFNGKELTTLRWAPYAVELTDYLQVGENKLEVIASTDLFNLMGPGWISGIAEDEFVGPGSFIDFSRYTEKYTLLPFGLGKARIWQAEK